MNGEDHAAARAKLSAALREWNRLDDDQQEHAMRRDDVGEIIARSDAEVAAEERAERARLTTEVAELRTLMQQMVENTAQKPEPERRSTMSAARKSELIRSLGVEKYNQFPW